MLDITTEKVEKLEKLDAVNQKNHKYIKQMVKGLDKFFVAGKNGGYGDAYRDLASSSYDIYLFSLGETYADTAATYYSYASQHYRDAKAFFKQAEQYSTSNNTQELAQLFVNLSEINAQIREEDHMKPTNILPRHVITMIVIIIEQEVTK